MERPRHTSRCHSSRSISLSSSNNNSQCGGRNNNNKSNVVHDNSRIITSFLENEEVLATLVSSGREELPPLSLLEILNEPRCLIKAKTPLLKDKCLAQLLNKGIVDGNIEYLKYFYSAITSNYTATADNTPMVVINLDGSDSSSSSSSGGGGGGGGGVDHDGGINQQQHAILLLFQQACQNGHTEQVEYSCKNHLFFPGDTTEAAVTDQGLLLGLNLAIQRNHYSVVYFLMESDYFYFHSLVDEKLLWRFNEVLLQIPDSELLLEYVNQKILCTYYRALLYPESVRDECTCQHYTSSVDNEDKNSFDESRFLKYNQHLFSAIGRAGSCDYYQILQQLLVRMVRDYVEHYKNSSDASVLYNAIVADQVALFVLVNANRTTMFKTSFIRMAILEQSVQILNFLMVEQKWVPDTALLRLLFYDDNDKPTPLLSTWKALIIDYDNNDGDNKKENLASQIARKLIEIPIHTQQICNTNIKAEYTDTTHCETCEKEADSRVREKSPNNKKTVACCVIV